MTRTSLRVAAAFGIAAVLLSGCGDLTGVSPASEGANAGRTAVVHEPKARAEKARKGPSRAKFDAYVASGRQQVKSLIDAFDGLYSDIRVRSDYPVGVKYEYVFTEFTDPAAGAAQLDKTVPVLRTTFKTLLAPELKRIGIPHPQVTWTYLNADESLIWTRTFPR